MNDQPPQVPPTTAPIPSHKPSTFAVLSLVFGILGVTCILPIIGSLLAIIFGIIALNEISKSGGQIIGHSQAVAGLITGAISLVMTPVFLAALLLPAIAQAKEKAREIVCMNNVKQISVACAMYADQHNGRLPRNFDDLKEVIHSTKIFICPSAKDKTHYSFAFTGATNLWQSAPDVVILREIEANHRGKRTLLYDDGHVEQRKN
ncbi:MAG: DUF4190 domain-containing protein [Verrucomicrobiia bacterium]|jgi:hypothetical protein